MPRLQQFQGDLGAQVPHLSNRALVGVGVPLFLQHLIHHSRHSEAVLLHQRPHD